MVESSKILIPALEAKRKALIDYKNNCTAETLKKMKETRAEAQRVGRNNANAFWQNLCTEIQDPFEQGNLKDHYNLMKIALCPSMKSLLLLKSKQGVPLTDKVGPQMDRWVEHSLNPIFTGSITKVTPRPNKKPPHPTSVSGAG